MSFQSKIPKNRHFSPHFLARKNRARSVALHCTLIPIESTLQPCNNQHGGGRWQHCVATQQERLATLAMYFEGWGQSKQHHDGEGRAVLNQKQPAANRWTFYRCSYCCNTQVNKILLYLLLLSYVFGFHPGVLLVIFLLPLFFLGDLSL